jgi:hypothetical protein
MAIRQRRHYRDIFKGLDGMPLLPLFGTAGRVCLAIALCGLLTTSAGRADAAEAKRPNIVFVFADDCAWQAISAYGEPRKLLQTLHIDRIGAEGMRFNRCLVPNSICGPSRATILTGTYSHLNGFYNP